MEQSFVLANYRHGPDTYSGNGVLCTCFEGKTNKQPDQIIVNCEYVNIFKEISIQ